MDNKLKVILISIMLIVLGYIFKEIRKNKISTGYALIWVIADIFVILVVLFVESLFKVANFIGIKTVSNMMFFVGFIFLLILCFNLSNKLSVQNEKIINLTQELGILKNKLNKEKNNNDKKI